VTQITIHRKHSRHANFVQDDRIPAAPQSAHITEWEGKAMEEAEAIHVQPNLVTREERTRIARELHDTLLQTFLSALIQLGVAVESLPYDSPVKPRLDRIVQLMDQGIKEGRDAIQGLRSSDSRAVDLARAFSELQQEIGVPPEIDFRVIVIGQKRPLHSRIADEVYRIGCEALVNALRHSGARRVELELEYTDTDLCMRVRDDGCGIDSRLLHAGREGHWGLTGMRERATEIGALLKIFSGAADGTEVRLSVPNASAFGSDSCFAVLEKTGTSVPSGGQLPKRRYGGRLVAAQVNSEDSMTLRVARTPRRPLGRRTGKIAS